MTPGRELFRKAFWPLLLVAVMAGVVTAITTARMNPGVEVAQAFTVPMPVNEETVKTAVLSSGELVLDALQSSERFADTLAGWAASPDFVSAVYARARVSFPGGATVRRLSRAFIVQKRGGSVVEVRFQASEEREGVALARAVADELKERVRAFNESAVSVNFQVSAGTPLVVPVLVSPPLRAAAAAVITFVIALNLVLLWDLLKPTAGEASDRQS